MVSDAQILHARPHHVRVQHPFTIRFATRPPASPMFAPGVPQVLRDFHSADKLLGFFIVSVYVPDYATGPLPVAPCPEAYGRLPVYHIGNVPFIVFTRSERQPEHAHWIPLPPGCCQVDSNCNWWWNYRRSICSEAKRRTLHLRLSYPVPHILVCAHLRNNFRRARLDSNIRKRPFITHRYTASSTCLPFTGANSELLCRRINPIRLVGHSSLHRS